MKKKLKKYLEMREQEMRMKMQDLERQVAELGRRVDELEKDYSQMFRELHIEDDEKERLIESVRQYKKYKSHVKVDLDVIMDRASKTIN